MNPLGDNIIFDFVFPNELHVVWSVMIVLYPYITGLVAGAFIISSLYHVFERKELRSIARYSLVASLVFLGFATLPLLVHLGRPERAFNIMITPHFTSAMAGFGYIYLMYMSILAIEVWFLFRGELVERANESQGIKKFIYTALALFDLTINEETKAFDKKVITFFAAVGIPAACLLHGYVGFLFGSIKANPWWSTPLMLPIFILSAIVSGISVIIFKYFLVSYIQGFEINDKCLKTLSSFLWGFMIIDVCMELLELLSISYQQTGEWEILSYLIYQKLWIPYLVIQLGICSFIPFILLGINTIFDLKRSTARACVFISSILLLCQVLAMRWNVVIGGGMISKSMRGFSSYFPGIFEKEGLFTAFIIFTCPFIILYLVDRIFPLFKFKGYDQETVALTTDEH
ncbi:MAG: polysulfide reductase NrfD [Candidatus Riflebacteria bacterium]|nr:polysulfide reductase NrfD [Candidatus Riflebacteria bacterium]